MGGCAQQIQYSSSTASSVLHPMSFASQVDPVGNQQLKHVSNKPQFVVQIMNEPLSPLGFGMMIHSALGTYLNQETRSEVGVIEVGREDIPYVRRSLIAKN